jgi:hypothetical protein
MPAWEEGNIREWTTMPVDFSFEEASPLLNRSA